MGRIYDAVIMFLRADNWNFTPVARQFEIWMSVEGQNGRLRCLAEAREEEKQFVFYSYYGVKVPENKRQASAEFLTRANYGLVIGNFEMDMSDGEVRYKTSIDVEDAPLPASEIQAMIYLNILVADRYLPGLMALLSGDVSPEQALAQVDIARQETTTASS